MRDLTKKPATLNEVVFTALSKRCFIERPTKKDWLMVGYFRFELASDPHDAVRLQACETLGGAFDLAKPTPYLESASELAELVAHHDMQADYCTGAPRATESAHATKAVLSSFFRLVVGIYVDKIALLYKHMELEEEACKRCQRIWQTPRVRHLERST